MNDVRKQYRKTLTRMGITMLVWAFLFNILMLAASFIDFIIPMSWSEEAYEIISSLLYDAAYLGAFMLPLAFLKLISDRKKLEPMRFEIKLSWEALALISCGVVCLFAFSYVNGIMMDVLRIPDGESLITEATEKMSDNGLILQFITLALVPAFCEEFLFRGVILSNLMPYGRATAIVISSVLFGLMHGNLEQFLYTTVGGIMLGLIYVLTDSIWCSVLMHMINNSISVLQIAIYDRLAEPYASGIYAMLVGLVFLCGLASMVYLAVRFGKKSRAPQSEIKSFFGASEGQDRTESLPVGVRNGLTATDVIDFLKNPMILLFAAYSLLSAVLMLVL